MFRASACLICESPALRSRTGIVAPFIAHRVWDKTPFAVEIAECSACAFHFANPRLEPEEERRLYADYRGERYQAMRHRFEPWYTKRFNERLATGTLTKRRQQLKKIFDNYLPYGITSLLDFGGDRGDLCEGLIAGAKTYVYDISGIAAAAGVTALKTKTACAEIRPDLVVCSNVLEHVGTPISVAAEMRSAGRQCGMVFVEVPSENPLAAGQLMKRSLQEAWLLAARPKIGVSLLPLKFARQVHEHINFFSERALIALLSKAGFEVTNSGTYPSEGYSFGIYKSGMMAWAIARVH